MKETLIRMVNAARECMSADRKLQEIGFENTPLFNIYGTIADAIYYLIDEKTDTFEESMTFQVLNDETLSDEECADMLLYHKQRLLIQRYVGMFG